MPPPFVVKLQSHDPKWAADADAEKGRLLKALTGLQEVHHIGSTAIPGIVAKPIIDLLGVGLSLAHLDNERSIIERLGYVWHGQYGLAGRRYCTLTHPGSGERRIQLHCYAEGDPSITRHLAFRDYLRAKPEVAAAYEKEKMRCAELNRDDSHAYAACKHDWINRIEAEALSNALNVR